MNNKSTLRQVRNSLMLTYFKPQSNTNSLCLWRTALILFFYIFLNIHYLKSQIKYDRGSVSYLCLTKPSEKESNELVQYINYKNVPDKYFLNSIPTTTFERQVRRVNPIDYTQFVHWDTLSQWLKEEKIGHELLSLWFNRDSLGYFNIDTLSRRGLYNANNQDFKVALSSKRGIQSIMDDGLRLIDQSYILIFDFYGLRTFEDNYNAQKIPAKERDTEGFIVKAMVYLYKLPFGETEANFFFENFWPLENDVLNDKRIKAFEQHDFILQGRASKSIVLTASQSKKQIISFKKKKNREDLFKELAEKAVQSGLSMMDQVEKSMKIRAMVTSVRPIVANIGKKEGLRFENRYFIYENQLDKQGNLKPKRKGVVKAYKIEDNTDIQDGISSGSRFYQIGGDKIDPLGLYLVERKDLGFNIFAGVTGGAKEGLYFRGEYFISKNLGRLVKSGRSGKWLTSTLLYFEIQTTGGERSSNNSSYTFGLGRSIYLGRSLHITPIIGIGNVTSKLGGFTQERASLGRWEYGSRLGVNLRHNIQFMLDFSMTKALGEAKRIDSEGDVIGPYNGNALLDRVGSSFGFGLRLML